MLCGEGQSLPSCLNWLPFLFIWGLINGACADSVTFFLTEVLTTQRVTTQPRWRAAPLAIWMVLHFQNTPLTPAGSVGFVVCSFMTACPLSLSFPRRYPCLPITNQVPETQWPQTGHIHTLCEAEQATETRSVSIQTNELSLFYAGLDKFPSTASKPQL